MQLTGARGSAVLLLDKDGWLRLTHRAGFPAYNLDRLPVEGSIAGQAIQTGNPVWVNRDSSDVAEAPDQWHGLPWTPGLRSMLSVPLKVDNQAIGALNVLDKPGEITQEDIRVISLFADQAAIIIEHVRLQRQAEQVAVLEERQRLARELHDSVTQALYSVTLYADAARMALSAKQWEALDRNLQEVRKMAREAMYDMRLLVFELRPMMLEKEGLASALRARLVAVEGRAGLKTEVLVEGERRLPIQIEEELYRIAQEGLNNVIKHAKASEVRIHITYEENAVRLQMTDDGIGFDTQIAHSDGGVGLPSIQERVKQLGGNLEIESTLGEGTHLNVRIPTGRTSQEVEQGSGESE
jgi:signal transduction histidine kinase